MIRFMRKDRLPIVILCFVWLVLFALGGYAAALCLRSDSPDALIRTAAETAKPTSAPVIVAASTTPVPSERPVWVTAAPDSDDRAQPAPFWSQGILRRSDSYRSPTLSVTVTKVRDTESFRCISVYYVADIHVRDVTQIKTASTTGNFAKRSHGDVESTAKKNASLVAISGDYYSAHRNGMVVRNGTVFRQTTGFGDVCVLLKNGVMKTILKEDVNVESILKEDPWQVWEFGPALLDENGNARTSFPGTKIGGENPRCCIGYVEPGHYYFVVADGRVKATRGMTLVDLAKLMESLGCTVAYNLDGGASAHFFWNGAIRNHPSGGGREISDIIFVAKESYPASRFFCGNGGTKK